MTSKYPPWIIHHTTRDNNLQWQRNFESNLGFWSLCWLDVGTSYHYAVKNRRCWWFFPLIVNIMILKKIPMSDSVFNKFADLQPTTLLWKRLMHRCFPMTLKISVLKNTPGWMLLERFTKNTRNIVKLNDKELL